MTEVPNIYKELNAEKFELHFLFYIYGFIAACFNVEAYLVFSRRSRTELFAKIANSYLRKLATYESLDSKI